MSFNINSDKEFIKASKPQIIGTSEFAIRSGVGVDEKEVIRTLLDDEEKLPRVGINRTGQRVNNISVLTGGSGYTVVPTVTVGPPPDVEGAVQALASAFIFNGRVSSIAINNPGKGYTSAPSVTITGGNGAGASAEAFLDTVDFELDINGAIRTSTSIISDTARILNLDIDNFVTPDANFRGPNLKTYMNNTGTIWSANVIVQKDSYRYFGSNVYQALNAGQTGDFAPEHLDGVVLNGEVELKHIGFRVVDASSFGYNETGEAGVYPRSITPLLGDRSDKIATTEYVLNLATNDVGGRIYVSSQIGSDLNDGRSAVNPVRTIKRAAQLAWDTPGVKETIIVSGGDYVEDNPISLPPDASVVGDNLRLVIIRPNNPGKHIFKFGDKNYVIGVTYRDKIDANGDAVATWDFAMVFDDKQRILIDKEVNGDFGVNFPTGHQVFGPSKFKIDFQNNSGLAQLTTGLEAVGVNTGARGDISNVVFTDLTGNNAYRNGSLDIVITSGSFLSGEGFRYLISGTQGALLDTSSGTTRANALDNTFEMSTDPTLSNIIPGGYVYIDGTQNTLVGNGFYEVLQIDDDSAPAYYVTVAPILGSVGWREEQAGQLSIYAASVDEGQFDSTSINSIRAEGEVVYTTEDFDTPLPITRLDFTLQGTFTDGFQEDIFGNAEDLGGVVFYTNALVGRDNTHDFKEGEEILIEGMPTISPDLSFLNGLQRIYKVLEDPDGRARRFVIPKKVDSSLGLNSNNNFNPGQFATVKSATRSVTLSLLNSPNTFPVATPVDRRFQDAVTFIRNNRDFIADEVVGKINDEFKKEYYSAYNISGTPSQAFTPTDVSYDPATGDAVFTVANHGLIAGDGIRIEDDSIVFTCAMDGNKTEHSAPQSHHFATGKTLPIASATTNTFTVNVGASGPDQQYTPSNAGYNPATGDLVLTIGTHSLSEGEGVVLDDNSISFTCTMDGNDSIKTYPRPGIDPYASRSIPIKSVTETTITLDVGESAANQYFTPTNATYDPVTGDMTVTVGQHGLGVGRNVVLADNSFTFTCALDGNQTQHTYPRPGTDPYAGKSIAITSVGSTQHTATDVDYDAATGDTVITVTSHGFTTGDYIKIADGTLNFTCDLDGNTVTKSYPRSGYDYPSGRWLSITVVDSDKFRVNIGPSSYEGTHTFVSASNNGIDRQDGTFTINVGTSSDTSAHTFVSASPGAVKHEPQSVHTFAGASANAVKHLPQSAHTFVRAATNAVKVGGAAFDIYLGTSRFAHTYVSGGTATVGGVTYNVTNFLYDNIVTGVATVTVDVAIPTITDDTTVRLADILVNCSNGQKSYPSFNIPVDDNQCRQDVVHYLNAITRDLEFGSNHNIIEAATKYIVGAKIDYVENEIIQTVRAIEYTTQLAIFAMCNWRTRTRTPGEPVYVPQYSSLPRYFDDTVITTTATDGGTIACSNVESAIRTLSFIYVDVLANNQNGTYLDAAYLIARNRDLIADLALSDTESLYPSLNLSDIHQRKCRRDISYILGGLIRDLSLGGNSGIVTNAETYFTNAALTGIDASQLDETRYAYTRVAEYAKSAMRNWSTSTISEVEEVTPTTANYNSTSGELVVQIPTPSTIPDLNDRLAFKEGAITFNCTSSGGGDLASPQPTDRNYGKSLTITNVNNLGGGILEITVNVGDAGTAAGVSHTFVSALADGTIIIYNPVDTSNSDIPKFEDWNILLYPTTPLCSNVATTIDTSFALLDGILEYAADDQSLTAIQPGSTTIDYGTLYDTENIISYPDSYIYDANNQRMAIRGDYDDYPIIEASPYTQNSSVISFLGGGGAEVDGAKVKQPNCPFPGLELDGTASFPNQGKSMVAAAFTIVSFGGVGYRVVNDGYTQLVSVFVIFCADGVLAESGGYCSITNSATNFGQFALRAIGYREDPYVFDAGYFSEGNYIRAVVTNVSQTPTGRTILTIENLGREPLEHYILKVDGYRNLDEDTEYFIEEVTQVGAGPPFTATCIFDDGSGSSIEMVDISTGQTVGPATLDGKTIGLHRPSIVNSSSHTWEFAGSGTNYLALPENGGVKVEANEQVSEFYGRVYVSGTDELGDFKVGTFAKIENRTGAITFTGTVTISEVEFLKLKGGDVVVTGFDDSNTLGGASSSDSKIPTQKAVRDFITNNLGAYIQKEYSTNSVPRALVELTDSGKISLDQIPALRPFEVYTISNLSERLKIEGALAGDIAIQTDTQESFILNNDNDSLFLAFTVDPTLSFTINDIFEGSVSKGQIQATEYRQGIVYTIVVTDPGSGYTIPPTLTISGGSPGLGAISASASCTIANGQVVTVSIDEFNGYIGGYGYTTQPVVTFSAPPAGGTQATGLALIESRLYGSIVNAIKITDTDTFQSSDVPAETINITRVINTSASNTNNWVSLSTTTVDARDITGGPIATDLLATNSTAANSYTFLRGDQSYALAVQSLKSPEERYFAQLTVPAQSGSINMVFATNQNALSGHLIVNSVLGIQEETIIQSVTTESGLTTVGFSQEKALTSTIPAGTIIEFRRAASPIRFDSTYTEGNFIEEIIIANGGNGYTNGEYFGETITGGNGTGLKATFIVENNQVTDVLITDGGSNYTQDFSTNIAPTNLGSGTGLDLRCKRSTINRQYANVTVDIDRVQEGSVDPEYGTVGVARFDKAQFFINTDGEGSIRLKTASNSVDSGLDADLLDGKQGSFYQNASSLTSGTLDSDRLSGSYNIDISGQSQNTIRLLSGINNPSSNPSPNTFSTGIISDTKNNNADQLVDGGTKHLVMTIRPGPDATYGGIRQLAFTDNDNMWLRGSGTGVTTFGTWAKIWTSENDGIDTGLDADRLDNKQGTWYQNALNINYGELSANRLPAFQAATSFRNTIKVKSYNGDPKYNIYVSGRILSTLPTPNPFTPGNAIKLYNANSQAVGDLEIDNLIINDDTNDNFNDYTIVVARLISGNFTGALTIGTASNRVEFQDFTIADDNNIDIITLESDGGTANMRLGRVDGVSSNPGIYFSSSQVAANYNSSIVATGGTGVDGSGTLNVQVVDADGFTVKGNIIWNEGNVAFNNTNVVSSYDGLGIPTLRSAVMRDQNGDFSANQITVKAGFDGIVGASSLNVLKSGDTMTGTLDITGAGSALTVQGTTGLTGNVTMDNDLVVGSNVLFVDASEEEVGIGTNNPPDKLHVNGGALSISSGSGANSIGTTNGFGIVYDSTNGIAYQLSKSTSGNTSITWGTSESGTLTNKLTLDPSGDFYPLLSTQDLGLNSTNNIWRNAYIKNVYAKSSLSVHDASGNNGAPAYFLGASGFRNFRVGNQLLADDTFEITASTGNGGTSWGTTPALFIQGSTNRVAINTTNFSGTDTSGDTPVSRNYQLNIQGDLNFNGQLFQNNEEFVTSRWTLNKTTNNIWRLSKVGVGKENPTYTLETAPLFDGSTLVNDGSVNVSGSTFSSGVNTSVVYANQDPQYVDTYGIFKTNRNIVNENITIPAATNAMSAGPLTINNGITITIPAGSSWSVV